MNQENEVNTQHDIWVRISQITVPAEVRVHTQEDIDSRAVSMARDGQAQPILLSKEGDALVLVYGNGRFESAKKLGWEKIRADIKEGLTESQKLMLTLVENEERENTSPFYTASLYKRIMAVEGIEPVKLAEKLGKSLPLISQVLALAELPEEVKINFTRVKLDFSHIRELCRLQNAEQQIQLAQECADKDYSVRELQARVKKLLSPTQSKDDSPKPADPGLHFTWKGDQLVIRGFMDANHGPAVLSDELTHALFQFIREHPRPMAKEVAIAA